MGVCLALGVFLLGAAVGALLTRIQLLGLRHRSKSWAAL